MFDVADSTADWSVAVTSGLGAILNTERLLLLFLVLDHKKGRSGSVGAASNGRMRRVVSCSSCASLRSLQ